MPDKAILVSIRDRVQGVSYRFWTVGEAEALGLRGWVRNEPDGSVTALISGTEGAVAKMLDLFRSGPPGARVASVTTDPADPGNVPAGFSVTR